MTVFDEIFNFADLMRVERRFLDPGTDMVNLMERQWDIIRYHNLID